MSLLERCPHFRDVLSTVLLKKDYLAIDHTPIATAQLYMKKEDLGDIKSVLY